MSETLPYVSGSETSEAAAGSMRGKAATLREQVYELLLLEGPLTDEMMQDKLKMNPSTQRPRRIELVEDGRVTDSGSTALTKSKREAVLWKVT